MKSRFLLMLYLLLIHSGCSKGKDCVQLYNDVISFENRTNRNIELEFLDSNSELYTVEMKSLESEKSRVVKEYYVTHEGSF